MRPAKRNIKFCFPPYSGSESASSGAARVFFVPLRTAVLCPFSFPFGRRGNLRDAIKFKFRPVLGTLAENLSMVPQITEQRPDLTRGAAWFVSKEEIDECEKTYGRDIVLLPAPAAFAAEMQNGGVAVWSSPSSSSAIWFDKDSVPLFYRYMPASEGDAAELGEWMRRYASAEGADLPPESVLIFSGEDMPEEGLRLAAEASFAASPSLARLDLSNRGASSAERCDVFSASCFAFLKAAAAVGVIFLILSFVLLLQNRHASASFQSVPGEICSALLGENPKNPLAYTAKRLKLLSGASSQLSFETVLAGLAAAWNELPDRKSVRIDVLRYGSERTEAEGTASNTGDIDKLREALNKNGLSAKTGGVQQVPGSGMRFTLILSAGGGVE